MNFDLSKATEKIQKMIDDAIGALPNLAIAIIVFVIFILLAKAVRVIVRRVFKKIGHKQQVGSVIGRLGEAAVVIIGVLAALPIVAPSFGAGDIVKILGLGSVAVGFAFKDIFQNFFAGILILLTDPFRVGDQIVVEGSKDLEGTVERIDTRATMIKTYDNRRVVIPNAKLFTNSVIVNTAFENRRTSVVVGIGMDEDVDKARKVILNAIKDIDGVLDDPAPSVVVAKIGNYTLDLNVRWWTESKRSEVVAAQDKVVAAIKEACAENDISIPDPIREVHFFDKTDRNNGEDSKKRDGAAKSRSRS